VEAITCSGWRRASGNAQGGDVDFAGEEIGSEKTAGDDRDRHEHAVRG
jgi:hypothetical protein